MQIEDLKPGDVLLFSPEKGSFISWAITFLTDAPVSHAAMYYDANSQKIIEETPPKVAINDAHTRFHERTITVRRLKKGLTMDPVVNAATYYYNQNQPYDMAGLYLVGAILIQKKFTPTSTQQKIITKILMKLADSLDDIIASRKDGGKTPMVCSQFIAQCFEDAGPDYKLTIKNGVIINERGMKPTKSLLEMAHEAEPSMPAQQKSRSIPTRIEQTEEELCKELYHTFVNNKDNSSNEPFQLSKELLNAITRFGNAHKKLINLSGKTTDGNSNVEHLLDSKNMFITPADLLKHCENFEDVGTISL